MLLLIGWRTNRMSKIIFQINKHLVLFVWARRKSSKEKEEENKGKKESDKIKGSYLKHVLPYKVGVLSLEIGSLLVAK